MITKYKVELLKDDVVIPGSGNEYILETHTSFWDVIGDIIDIGPSVGSGVLNFVASNYIGVVGDVGSIVKKVLEGSKHEFACKNVSRILGNEWINRIRIIFRAESEDELKSATCLIVGQPKEARDIEESIDNNSDTKVFEVKFNLYINDLNTNIYSFIVGAQDNGWYDDHAHINMLDISFIKDSKINCFNPDLHNYKNIKTDERNARLYADINIKLASYGVNLGSDGANSQNYDVHLNWAKNQSVEIIEKETMRKLFILAEDRKKFLDVYTDISMQLAKTGLLGTGGAGGLDRNGHYNWCKSTIQYYNTTIFVRNHLVEKTYSVFEN